MIGFFPEIYPDELLYSQLCRYHRRNGYTAFRFTCDDVYRNRAVHPDMEFLNAFSEDAMGWIIKRQPLESIIGQHTMFPAYARFLPQERREKAFHVLYAQSGGWNNLLCIPRTGIRYLRYCPECAREDREIYGETYWHREHQVRRIRICPKHGCFLSDSTVQMDGKATPGFYDAESCVPQESDVCICDSPTEINFTEYLLEVFRHPVDLSNDTPVGMFLHEHLGNYVDKSGLVRDIGRLYGDYTKYFNGMPVMEPSALQKIFNGYRYDNYFVCQLAFFLNITVEELTHITPKGKPYGPESLYQNLSEKYGVPLPTVRKIGREVLRYEKQQSCIQQTSGVRAKQYDALDEELLPQVKAFVKAFLSEPGKPQKLSAAIVQRALQLPPKQLRHLPKCNRYVQSHMESQPEYWARFLTWAVGDIEQTGDRLCFKQITNRLFLRKGDLHAALPFIRDEYVRDAIEQMVGEK